MNCTPKVRRKTFGVQFTGAASFFARKLGNYSRFSNIVNASKSEHHKILPLSEVG